MSSKPNYRHTPHNIDSTSGFLKRPVFDLTSNSDRPDTKIDDTTLQIRTYFRDLFSAYKTREVISSLLEHGRSLESLFAEVALLIQEVVKLELPTYLQKLTRNSTNSFKNARSVLNDTIERLEQCSSDAATFFKLFVPDEMTQRLHDLKSKLTSTVASVEMIAEESGLSIDPNVVRVKRSTDQLLQQLDKLINEFQDNKKLLTKLGVNFPQSVLKRRSEYVLQSLKRSVAEGAYQKPLETTLSFVEPSHEFRAFIDPEKIQSIIDNLISNAKKYSVVGSNIEVRLQKISDSHFTIEVEGTSVNGITEDQYDSIWKEGVHTASNTQNQKSHGLGLSSVKRYAEAHGGRVEVESRKGNNVKTTFRVILPISYHEQSGVINTNIRTGPTAKTAAA